MARTPSANNSRGTVPVWLLFTAIAFLVAPLPAVNEPHYLCKARSLAHPDWCQRDFFLQSANAHYCFLKLTGFATQMAPLWLVATLGRIASCGLLACGWSRITATLGLAARCGYAAAVLFVAGNLAGSFSGEWVLGGFESKVPAWGLALLAIAGWLNAANCYPAPHRILLTAGLYSGLGSALHPVVGGWLAVCLCLAQVCCGPGGLPQRLRTAAVRHPCSAGSAARPAACHQLSEGGSQQRSGSVPSRVHSGVLATAASPGSHGTHGSAMAVRTGAAADHRIQSTATDNRPTARGSTAAGIAGRVTADCCGRDCDWLAQCSC